MKLLVADFGTVATRPLSMSPPMSQLLLVLLISSAGCDRTPPLDFPAFDGAQQMTALELADRVDVRRLDFSLPTDDPEECKERLWRALVEDNQHLDSFASVELSVATKDEYWSVLANEILQRADGLAPETAALAVALSDMREGDSRIPIACYLVRAGEGDAWLIVCAWEVNFEQPTPVSHVHVRAVDAASGALLAEARCD